MILEPLEESTTFEDGTEVASAVFILPETNEESSYVRKLAKLWEQMNPTQIVTVDGERFKGVLLAIEEGDGEDDEDEDDEDEDDEDEDEGAPRRSFTFEHTRPDGRKFSLRIG